MKFCSGILCVRESTGGGGKLLPKTAFAKDKHKGDGLQSRCRRCKAFIERERRLKKKLKKQNLVDETSPEQINLDVRNIRKTCVDCRCESWGTDFRIDLKESDKLSKRCRACERILCHATSRAN